MSSKGSDSMSDLLSVDSVSKSFGGVVALNDFSVSIAKGERVGLIGPNGAGKTTLFNVISGLLTEDSGTIYFGGSSLGGVKPHRRVSMGISRTFQITRPFPSMTVMENVMAGAIFGGGATVRQASDRSGGLLDRVSLSEKADLPAGELTLADQRRLELARALATSPRLLLLDEVMAGLSPIERSSLVELVTQISSEEGIALLVSEHIMDSLSRLCTRIVVMDRGTKRGEGVTHDVLGSDLVAEVYLGRKRRGGD